MQRTNFGYEYFNEWVPFGKVNDSIDPYVLAVSRGYLDLAEVWLFCVCLFVSFLTKYILQEMKVRGAVTENLAKYLGWAEVDLTPLHVASCKGQVKMVKLLVKYGADLKGIRNSEEKSGDSERINY